MICVFYSKYKEFAWCDYHYIYLTDISLNFNKFIVYPVKPINLERFLKDNLEVEE